MHHTFPLVGLTSRTMHFSESFSMLSYIFFGTLSLCYLYIYFLGQLLNWGTNVIRLFPINGISVQLEICTPLGYSRSSKCCCGILPIGHHFLCHLGAPGPGGISVTNTTGFRGAL